MGGQCLPTGNLLGEGWCVSIIMVTILVKPGFRVVSQGMLRIRGSETQSDKAIHIKAGFLAPVNIWIQFFGFSDTDRWTTSSGTLRVFHGVKLGIDLKSQRYIYSAYLYMLPANEILQKYVC